VFTDLTVGPVAGSTSRTVTCKRLMGHFTIDPIIPDQVEIAIGIAVVTKDAVSGPQFPDPLTDSDYGWYYWTNRVIDALTGIGPAQLDWEIDIRTARTIREGMRLVVISESKSSNNAKALHMAFRALWTI